MLLYIFPYVCISMYHTLTLYTQYSSVHTHSYMHR